MHSPLITLSEYYSEYRIHSLHVAIYGRRRLQFIRKKSKILRIVKYYAHIWNQNDKWITMSTNKSIFGPVVLEIACGILLSNVSSFHCKPVVGMIVVMSNGKVTWPPCLVSVWVEWVMSSTLCACLVWLHCRRQCQFVKNFLFKFVQKNFYKYHVIWNQYMKKISKCLCGQFYNVLTKRK